MIEENHCYDWHDFRRVLSQDVFNGVPKRDRFLFRGQGNADWSLCSSFDREYGHLDPKERNNIEQLLIQNFAKECEKDPNLRQIISSSKNNETILALGQHYGLPTRLLDWTDSPYIAAFFAFASRFRNISLSLDSPVNVAVWVLDKSSVIWDENCGVKVLRPTSWDNPRLSAQSGWFTLSKTPFRTLEEYARQFPEMPNALRKIVINSNTFHEAIADLDMMNINDSTLFGDKEGKARSAITKTMLALQTN